MGKETWRWPGPTSSSPEGHAKAQVASALAAGTESRARVNPKQGSQQAASVPEAAVDAYLGQGSSTSRRFSFRPKAEATKGACLVRPGPETCSCSGHRLAE